MSAHNHNSGEDAGFALDESAEELYDLAPCGYLTTTADGRIVKVNRTLCEWLGFASHDLTGGMRFAELLTIGGKIFYDTHFALLLRVRSSVDEIALDIIRKDGSTLPTLINARQKRNAAGEPVLNRFTVFNASERRLYERQLLSARDLLRTTLSSIGDGVIATDAEGRVTFMNPVAEELSGWHADSAQGKPIEEIMPLVREDTSAPVENPIRHALRTGTMVGLANHTTLIAKDGREIPIDDSASPIREDNGKVVGAVLVFRDISGRRRTERALSEAHRQLESTAADLRRSNEDLSRFAYEASHDLRSPLNNVIQFAELLEQGYGDQLGEGQELLVHLRNAARRMGRLIEDLLLYAGLSTDAAHASGSADANVQLEIALENLRGAVTETGASITHDRLPVVPVHGTGLVQIFQNLIGNAIHYRGRLAPVIHVSVLERSDYWLFSCRDNGIGIAPEFQTQIFEPFKRLHGSDRPGSGIGLAVCRRIVEKYNSRIWVESQVDQGSTFLFTLPKRWPPEDIGTA